MTRSVDWSLTLKDWVTTTGALSADADVDAVIAFLEAALKRSEVNKLEFVRFGEKSQAVIRTNGPWLNIDTAVELAIISLKQHRRLWRLEQDPPVTQVVYEFPVQKSDEVIVLYFKFLCPSDSNSLPSVETTKSILVSVHPNSKNLKFTYEE